MRKADNSQALLSMSLIEKRSCIWSLHSIAEECLKCAQASINKSGLHRRSEIIQLLSNFGVDIRSDTIIEIIQFATVGEEEVDVQSLFHVVAESVSRVNNRNLLFWNTVMTVSGASIAWIDFRRKFSRWLSANGMGIGYSKSVISFVQSNLDRTNSGVVRKDTFLKFAEDLMGIECLLSPEGLVSLDNSIPVRYESVRKPTPQRPVTVDRGRVGAKPASTPPLPVILPEPSVRTLLMTEASPQIVVERVSEHVYSNRRLAEKQANALENIRIKLAIGAIQKVFFGRIRIVLAIFRIARNERVASTRAKNSVKNPRAQAGLLGLYLRLISQRVLLHVFYRLQSFAERAGKHELSDPDVTDDTAGPSWTVTIQAVAVSNLFGILRSSLGRAIMPAFFSIKGGRSVDEYNPVKKVSWAQSKQGKQDSQTALQDNIAVLKPINENAPFGRVEFDLSS